MNNCVRYWSKVCHCASPEPCLISCMTHRNSPGWSRRMCFFSSEDVTNLASHFGCEHLYGVSPERHREGSSSVNSNAKGCATNISVSVWIVWRELLQIYHFSTIFPELIMSHLYVFLHVQWGRRKLRMTCRTDHTDKVSLRCVDVCGTSVCWTERTPDHRCHRRTVFPHCAVCRKHKTRKELETQLLFPCLEVCRCLIWGGGWWNYRWTLLHITEASDWWLLCCLSTCRYKLQFFKIYCHNIMTTSLSKLQQLVCWRPHKQTFSMILASLWPCLWFFSFLGPFFMDTDHCTTETTHNSCSSQDVMIQSSNHSILVLIKVS